MEDNYTGGDICIDGSTDCIGNDIVYGSRTDIHLKEKPLQTERFFSRCEIRGTRIGNHEGQSPCHQDIYLLDEQSYYK